MTHPAVQHFADMLDALDQLAPFAASLGDTRIVVDVGPAPRVLRCAYGTTHPLFPTDLSAHRLLPLMEVHNALVAHAQAWHAATQAVPGMGTLVGEGRLVCDWPEGTICLAWTSEATHKVRARLEPGRPAYPTRSLTLDALQQAVDLPSVANGKLEVRAIVQKDHPVLLAEIPTTRAMIQALGPMLNVAASVEDVFHIGTNRSSFVNDFDIRKAHYELPKAAAEVVERVDTAIENYFHHLAHDRPAMLSFLKASILPAVKTTFIHVDEDYSLSREERNAATPFTDQDRAWMATAKKLWADFAQALPADGLWRCVDPHVILHSQSTPPVPKVVCRGGTGRDFRRTIPMAWLMPVEGRTYLMRTTNGGLIHRVLARTPLEAAAIGWEAHHTTYSPSDLDVTVWEMDDPAA